MYKYGIVSNNKIERSNQWGDYPKTVPSAQGEEKAVIPQVKNSKNVSSEHREVKTDVSILHTCQTNHLCLIGSYSGAPGPLVFLDQKFIFLHFVSPS